MKENILLIGGGGHCKSCIDVIEQEGKFKIAGIIDLKSKLGTTVLGYKIIGTDNDLPNLVHDIPNAILTLGQIQSANPRIKLFNQLKSCGFKLPIIISPLAWVSPHSNIGEGTIIMHQAMVNAGSKLGKNCIINSKALLEHDCAVGNHCHISTNATINGNVKVGDKSFIGSGAIIVNNLAVSENSFIKAGFLFKGNK